MYIRIYRIAGYFQGENFCKFHESSLNRENFALEMFYFSGYSAQSVMIRENFALEKLEKLSLRKFSPRKITCYMVYIREQAVLHKKLRMVKTFSYVHTWCLLIVTSNPWHAFVQVAPGNVGKNPKPRGCIVCVYQVAFEQHCISYKVYLCKTRNTRETDFQQ